MLEPTLRVACVQLDPVFKDPTASREKADRLIASLEVGTLDLLVLPEMAFSGYCFTSREDVTPCIEVPSTGATFAWASRTALKLGCYVQVGLPTVSSSSSSTSGPLYSNSTILVSPFGALVSVYSKHFLYETDFAWATPGPAFIALDLPFPPSSPFHSDRGRAFRLAPAICMDLNPKDFVAPFEAFEFASFAKQEEVDIVACSMSWLDSEPPRATAEEGEEEEGRTEWEKVHRTLGYWVMRMEPLMESGVAFVGCNRVGREGDTIFTGSSCAIELQDRPTVVKYATQRKEEVILAKVRLPPREH
ncbi:hypothetical protein JCM21900_003539 [Sporobolomyces salmonicolor]